MERCTQCKERWVTTGGEVCHTCVREARSDPRAPSPVNRTAVCDTPVPPRVPVCRLCGECFPEWGDVYRHKCRIQLPAKAPLSPAAFASKYSDLTTGE